MLSQGDTEFLKVGFLQYFIQHCFICRSSDSTVSEYAGIEARTDKMPFQHWLSDALITRLDLIHKRLDLIHKRLDLIHKWLDLFHRIFPTCHLSLSSWRLSRGTSAWSSSCIFSSFRSSSMILKPDNAWNNSTRMSWLKGTLSWDFYLAKSSSVWPLYYSISAGYNFKKFR